MKRWTVDMTEYVLTQLAIISDQRVQEALRTRIRRLELDPDKQGKPLSEELAGCRSIRAVGQRYRIIYRLEEEQVSVLVVTVGRRKDGDKNDVYSIAKRLARLGMFQQNNER